MDEETDEMKIHNPQAGKTVIQGKSQIRDESGAADLPYPIDPGNIFEF